MKDVLRDFSLGKKNPKAVYSEVEKLFQDTYDQTRAVLKRVWWRNILYYCLAEGTKIPLLDGRVVHIEDLVGQSGLWLYGFDLDKLKIVPALMTQAEQTGKKPCIEISLDNGHSFICTEDHRVLTWFGYKEAKDLEVGTPLVPYRNKYFKSQGAYGGYNQIFQPYDAVWEQVHRMVAREVYGETVQGNIIHHLNEDKQDNRPENLFMMSRQDHSTLTLEKHRDKILEGMTAYSRSEEGRRKKSESAKRQWAEKREVMLKAVSSYRKDPEYLDKLRKSVKEYWANVDNRKAETERRLGNRWAAKGEAINCRVIGTRPVGIKRVYDLSVPSTHNFALESGVFVHNCGEQWIEWSKVTKSFRKLSLPEHIHKPVSNEIREFVRSVKSMLLNQKMTPRIYPNTSEKEDKDAAEIGRDLLLWMDTLYNNEISKEKEKCAIMCAILGTTFMRSIPEIDGGEWFIGKDGVVRTTGDVSTRHIIPFNVYLDPFGENMRDKRWVGIQTLKSREWVEDTFKTKLTGSDEDMSSMNFTNSLMNLVTQVSDWKGQGMSQGLNPIEDENQVVFRELELKPTLKNPSGRYIVICRNEVLVDIDRMPIKVSKRGSWHYTPTDFHFNYVPGRFWSDSGVDDLISPQKSINEIDNALLENRKSLGRPMVLVPTDMSLQRKSEAGASILFLRYDGQLSGGQRPVFNQGLPLPQQVLEERLVHKAQIQELGGDPKNVLKGQAPSAHASGIMTDILRETAEQGHYPDVERYNTSMQELYQKRLLIAQEVFTEKRTIKIAGKGNKIKIRQFKASDLRNNTDVKMELDSGLATTKAGQREVLISLMDKGLFGDITGNPILRQELITRFGLAGFTDQTNVDVERAEDENSRFAAGVLDGIFLVATGAGGEIAVTLDSPVIEEDPLFNIDNHKIHKEVHRRFILSAEFKDYSTVIQKGCLIHYALHELRDGLEEEKQMMKMAKLNQVMNPKAQGGEGGGGAEGLSPVTPPASPEGGMI